MTNAKYMLRITFYTGAQVALNFQFSILTRKIKWND